MSPRYLLAIGSFLRSEGQDPPESNTAPSTMETSPNVPSSDAVPSMMSPPPAVPDVGQVARATPEEVTFPAPTSEASCKGKGKGKDKGNVSD